MKIRSLIWIVLMLLAIVGFKSKIFSIYQPASAKKSLKSNKKSSFRKIDGTKNNLKNPNWGSVRAQLLRTTAINYYDGISMPSNNPSNPRDISNIVFNQKESIPNSRNITDMFWLWGQFLDHDISLTEAAEPKEDISISIPAGDANFDPNNTGAMIIPLSRSIYDKETGTYTDKPRQQINLITSFIDGSNIYGSDKQRALALRTMEGGKLKTSNNNLLPFNTEGLHNAMGSSSNFFLAGDIRANENPALIAMHTLFVREHNRLADEISLLNPNFSDEKIYQIARRKVIAMLQVITYNEFLPTLFGGNFLIKYKSYKRNKNPSIANIFSTAAYRFGHSTISPNLLRLDNRGNEIAAGHLNLKESFFRPDLINSETDIGYILKGVSSQVMQEIDTKVDSSLRNFLFGKPGQGGMDLVAINIQRGRDHGPC